MDTTGAGDCFVAAIGLALAERQSVPAALAFASVAAGLAVTVFGAQAAMPTRAAVMVSLSSA